MDHSTHTPSCCGTESTHKHGFDYIFYGSLGILITATALHFFSFAPSWLHHFSEASLAMASTMWWGVVIGLFFVGIMSQVPREFFQVFMGDGNSISGLWRAVIAGIFLDLCSHGILLIAAKLYERGVSLPQVMAFLIASPWNSFSLTIILISLIGWQWTLVFIIASCIIAFMTGLGYMALIGKGYLDANPNTVSLPNDFSVFHEAKKRLKSFKITRQFIINIFKSSLHDGQMLIRWLLLGIVIASSIQTFIPANIMSDWLGPTLLGLFVTLIAATIIEVCSEGSVPIASVIFHKAAAPGNAFAFLMAGVSTDYTEMMILRQTTGSWKAALSLPFVTVPQILLIGYWMNIF